ncbi:YwdI family protein [Aquibacillus sediminis]|uniref:YwdI family protein n=1 Tax=Aquibacillus sediminis TaxID=2574734 RepID=UPI0011096AB8|nr:YwdI family protein [Aquibacillus sediminis]
MAITNESIINKMLHELENAKAKKDRDDAVREHIRAVRSLCDLILDQSSDVTSKQPTASNEQELKAMMGSLEFPQASPKQTSIQKQSTIDHGEANGKSLFDF